MKSTTTCLMSLWSQLLRPVPVLLCALVLLLTACTAEAKTVTIGSGSGDLSYPTAQTTLDLDPGDTLYINSGTYASFKLSNLAGTAVAPIIIQCDPSTVFYTTAGYKNNTFDNVSYVEFHDFRYETYASPLMKFSGASHDLLFKDFYVTDTSGYNFRAYDADMNFDGTKATTFYNFKWEDCTFEDNAGGVYMAPSANQDINDLNSLLLDFEVVGCTFTDYADGSYSLFNVGKAFNFVMHDCYVADYCNDGSYCGHNGLVFGWGYFKMHHNVFTRQWANDMRVTPVKLNALGYNGTDAICQFYDNISYDKAKYPMYCHRDADQDDLDNSSGYYSRTSSEVYFNTMYRSRAVDYVGTLVTIVGPNITIKDNLIVEPECDTTFDSEYNYVYNWGSGTQDNVTVDNNLVFETLAASGLEDAVDFVPGASSDALDAASGTVSYITDDVYYNDRYVGTAGDVGAVERQVPPLEVISPIAAWKADGSSVNPWANKAIDDQPTWDAENAEPVGEHLDGSSSCFTGDDATGYLDFGADWADIRITQTWTRYRAYASPTAHIPPDLTMWWDDDTDCTNDSGLNETTIDFGQHEFEENIGQTWPWYQDVDTTASPVTPQARYLLIRTPSDNTTRMNEFAFIGYTVE